MSFSRTGVVKRATRPAKIPTVTYAKSRPAKHVQTRPSRIRSIARLK